MVEFSFSAGHLEFGGYPGMGGVPDRDSVGPRAERVDEQMGVARRDKPRVSDPLWNT